MLSFKPKYHEEIKTGHDYGIFQGLEDVECAKE